MKPPDFKSTIIAALIGAVVAVIEDYIATPQGGTAPLTTAQAAMYGGLLGATVQVIVRITGVS